MPPRRDNADVSSGTRTTSIPRPSKPTRRSGGAADAGARSFIQRRPSRVVMGTIALAIVFALAAALLLLPLRDWLRQRDDLAERSAELVTLEQATARLAEDVARLQTPEGIEDAAREELGYVEQGEQRLAVVEVPSGSTDLPEGWPYSLVEQIIAARRGAPATTTP